MNVQVAYPIPCESPEVWATFKPFVERFADTWREHPPGIRCSLMAMMTTEDYSNEVDRLFKGIAYAQMPYHGGGFDLGAQQHLALHSDRDTFQVNFTTRAFFNSPGWLARLVSTRYKLGPNLYGMSCSKEGGRFHIATRGHCYDTDDFKLYPHDIVSRDQGVFFECGEGCLLEWFESIGRKGYVVGKTCVYEARRFECGAISNGFRDGDQSEMLVLDKHTELYAAASPEEKQRLTGRMLVG